jgi:ribonuclease Z
MAQIMLIFNLNKSVRLNLNKYFMADHQYNGVHLDAPLEEHLHIWTLGTGSPSLSVHRHGISTLIQAKGKWLLFDVGRATLQRMYECGIPIPDVTNVFFTHLHSDHICGMSDFWMTGWFVLHRKKPLRVFGPAGTRRMLEGLKELHHFDLSARSKYETALSSGKDFEVHEFGEETVFDEDGITVKAFLVDHGPAVKPAYGFRVDCDGRSVVLSGDTTICPGVLSHAAGCDVLIHEIAGASQRQLAANEITRRIISIHTDPVQMNQICKQTRPRLTMLNHISLWRVTQFDILHRVREGYDLPVELAQDRMEVLVGDQIRVFPAGPPKVAQDLIVSDTH